MIELTLKPNYEKIIINPKLIIWMKPYDKKGKIAAGTLIHTIDDMAWDVVETLTEINKKLTLCY